jgi:enamine deaminase RidA (YjgF/YER057c/UK114 family)
MKQQASKRAVSPRVPSAAAQAERKALGLPPTETAPRGCLQPAGGGSVQRRTVRAPGLLNEAFEYEPQSVAFVRGLKLSPRTVTEHVLLSGTASVGSEGQSLYPGDFHAQCWRTYRNLAGLLENAGATWRDVVRTRCYLRDIERDYDDFNAIRTEYFNALGLDPYPASVGIQARLCRSDLLVEIELDAMIEYRGER